MGSRNLTIISREMVCRFVPGTNISVEFMDSFESNEIFTKTVEHG